MNTTALFKTLNDLKSGKTTGEVTLKKVPGKINQEKKDIAVIGVALDLPQANTMEELFHVLRNGIDCISALSPSRMTDVEHNMTGKGIEKGMYTFNQAAFLPSISNFDYTFFNITRNEARVMDPAQRLFLQTAWHVFEDAGYPEQRIRGTRTAVFLGQPHPGDYYKLVKKYHPEMALVAGPGNIPALISGRVSYYFDLKGPNMIIDSSCSSSLVALHLACRALKNNECEMALVGGINLLYEPVHLKGEQRPEISSSNGKAKTFSDQADGTGQGEGVIGVLLKPLDKSQRDGDHIYAVIKGSSCNSDGNSIGITAPNGLSQEEVICSAWEEAGIDPLTLSYIEAHGTGTALGDPIEVDSLTRAFGRYTDRKQFCGVGSIKTNYGHLDSAAGLMGLVKIITGFRYKHLFPSLHFNKPNRKIEFESSPVYVVDRVRRWSTEEGNPYRAGLSAFGLSGTNCHLVLEEAPEIKAQIGNNATGMKILPVSAKSPESLNRYVRSYIRFLETTSDIDAQNLCYSAQIGKNHFSFRLAVMGYDTGDILKKLKQVEQIGCCTDRLSGIFYGNPNLGKSEDEGIESEYPKEIVTIARNYVTGEEINWGTLYGETKLPIMRLPLYPFEEKRSWVEIPQLNLQTQNTGQTVTSGCTNPGETVEATQVQEIQQEEVELRLKEYIAELFEIKAEEIDLEATYFDLGIDSISIIQLQHFVKKTYALEISANELFNRVNTPRLLALHIVGAGGGTPPQDQNISKRMVPSAKDGEETGRAAKVKNDQFLQLFVIKANQELTEQQQEYLSILAKRYETKTGKSKDYIRSIRPYWATGRFIQGYDKSWKELIYPIFAQRAQGVHIWDLDGNEYIDFAMGFGVNLLGYTHPVVVKAITDQLAKGAVLGAMTTLPGEVARLIHELTGVERVAFCNSGTEAVMNLVRIARGTTGKDKIALFAGSYHGTFDGVFVTTDGTSGGIEPVPRTLGTPADMIRNVIILEYGEENSLEIIKQHSHDLAAVLVEPVQSRNPLLQPGAFLQSLRQLTDELGIALIFDEIITGFRIHPGGAQAYFDVQADLVAYGKVLGGGMPIGIIAGKAKYMDRIDGGMWQYHDDSSPSGFLVQTAGTFSHHPLAMAAAKAVLEFLGTGGKEIIKQLNQRTAGLAYFLNNFFSRGNIPMQVAHFGSLFIFVAPHAPNLLRFLYYSLIEKGFYLWEGGTCFLSVEHREEQIFAFIKAIVKTCEELVEQGCYSFLLPKQPVLTEEINAAFDSVKENNTVKEVHFYHRNDRLNGLDLIINPKDKQKAVEMMTSDESIEHIFPLSPMQTLILAQNIRGYNTGHDVSLVEYTLFGDLDTQITRNAWQTIMNRYAILRTEFKWRRLAEPQQIVYKSLEIPYVFKDISNISGKEKELFYNDFIGTEKKQGFKKAPLIKLILVKYAEKEWRYIVKYQNSLIDGWSSTILFGEFAILYNAMKRQEAIALPKTVSYLQYIRWLHQQNQQKTHEFWKNQFQNFTEDYPSTHVEKDVLPDKKEEFSGAIASFSFSPEEIEKIQEYARKNKLNTYVLCQGAWILTLACSYSIRQLVFGTAVSGRPVNLEGSDQMVGLFTNVLPLPVTISGQIQLPQWLSQIQSVILELKQYEFVLIGQISQWTGIEEKILQEAVYNRTMVFLNYPKQSNTESLEGGLQVNISDEDTYPRVPIRLYIHPKPQFESIVYFDKNRYDQQEIQHRLEMFKSSVLMIVQSNECDTPASLYDRLKRVNTYTEEKD